MSVLETIPGGEIEVFRDPEEFARGAARRILALAQETARLRGRFRVALPGGRTPLPVFRELARHSPPNDFPWRETEIFFGDERCGAPDAPDNHFHQAQETLFRHVAIPPENIHRIAVDGADEESANRAAESYERLLRGSFSGSAAPAFDLLILGLGDDCHTASLYPGSAALGERDRWVAANYVRQRSSWRVTLTLPALQGSRAVMFLFTGGEKADALARVLAGTPDPNLAATQVRGREKTLFLCDPAAAAAALPGSGVARPDEHPSAGEP